MLIVICLFPMLMLAIQAPLWMAKLLLRFRIVPPGEQPGVAAPVELRIRHMMIGTLMVAIVLTLGRALGGLWGSSEPVVIIVLMVCAVVVSVFALMTLLPVLAIALRARREKNALLGSLLVGIGVPSAILVLLNIESLFSGDVSLFLVCSALIAGYACGVVGVLMLARRAGYRFVRDGEEPAGE